MSKTKKKKFPSRFKFIMHGILNNFKSNKNKSSTCQCGQDHSTPPSVEINSRSIQIALVVDGVVEDIIMCNERLGLLLLSNPDIIETEEEVGILWNYNEDDDSFSEPERLEML